MLFERLKKWLNVGSGPGIPLDARALFKNARTVRELLRGLDDLILRNEVELKDLQKEILDLEALEQAEVEKVRAGDLPERAKRMSLRAVQRLRRQMDNLENRIRIHEANMDLHVRLVGKVQAMEAMELRGVNEQQIDAILVEFEDQFRSYTETLEAASPLEEEPARLEIPSERELDSLEAEILSGKSAAPPAPAPPAAGKSPAAGRPAGEKSGAPAPPDRPGARERGAEPEAG